MEYRVDLHAIADLIAAEPERLVFETHRSPHPSTRRLMDTLGVEVVVTTVAQDVLTKCPHEGCLWTYVGTALQGKAAIPRHLAVMHGGRDPRADRDGRGALEAMDAGESVADLVMADVDALAPGPPQQVPGHPGTNHSRKKVTREEAIDAIRVFAEELGRPPRSGDWPKNGIRPSFHTIYRIFGTWDAALQAAGVTPPERESGREPTEPADTPPPEASQAAQPEPPEPARSVVPRTAAVRSGGRASRPAETREAPPRSPSDRRRTDHREHRLAGEAPRRGRPARAPRARIPEDRGRPADG